MRAKLFAKEPPEDSDQTLIKNSIG